MNKKKTHIEKELDFLEAKCREIKSYVEANPYHKVKDRTTIAYTKEGNPYEVIVQKIEIIHKSLRDALKDYAALIEQLDKLREKEDAKAEARGNKPVNKQMEKLLRGK